MTKLSSAETESIVALLTRIYTDLHAIEEQYQLLVGGDDFRPRGRPEGKRRPQLHG